MPMIKPVSELRNYLSFYRVTDSRVFIDRILYKHRDYFPLLGLQ